MHRFSALLGLLLAALTSMPLAAQDLSQPFVEGQVLVRFAPGLGTAQRDAARDALLPTGGRALGLVPGLEVVTTQLSVLQAIAVLSNNPNVLYAEPDYIVQPIAITTDPIVDDQWGLKNWGQDIRGVAGAPDADD